MSVGLWKAIRRRTVTLSATVTLQWRTIGPIQGDSGLRPYRPHRDRVRSPNVSKLRSPRKTCDSMENVIERKSVSLGVARNS